MQSSRVRLEICNLHHITIPGAFNCIKRLPSAVVQKGSCDVASKPEASTKALRRGRSKERANSRLRWPKAAASSASSISSYLPQPSTTIPNVPLRKNVQLPIFRGGLERLSITARDVKLRHLYDELSPSSSSQDAARPIKSNPPHEPPRPSLQSNASHRVATTLFVQ